MEVITYKCPNCGGDLTFDPASGKYKCEYCLSSFTQEEAEKANPGAAEAMNGEDNTAGAQEATDAQGGSGTAETKEKTAGSEAVVYTCPSCGAEIVTDALITLRAEGRSESGGPATWNTKKPASMMSGGRVRSGWTACRAMH